MKPHQMLPTELVWDDADDERHLGEVALTAIADRQDSILPSEALDHAATCDACAKKVGALALLSIDAGLAVTTAEAAREAAQAHSRRVAPISSRASRLPVFAVAAALLVATIGALPRLIELPGIVDSVGWFVRDGIATILDTVWSVIVGVKLARTIAIVSVASSVMFVVLAVLFARSRFAAKKAGMA